MSDHRKRLTQFLTRMGLILAVLDIVSVYFLPRFYGDHAFVVSVVNMTIAAGITYTLLFYKQVPELARFFGPFQQFLKTLRR